MRYPNEPKVLRALAHFMAKFRNLGDEMFGPDGDHSLKTNIVMQAVLGRSTLYEVCGHPRHIISRMPWGGHLYDVDIYGDVLGLNRVVAAAPDELYGDDLVEFPLAKVTDEEFMHIEVALLATGTDGFANSARRVQELRSEAPGRQ